MTLLSAIMGVYGAVRRPWGAGDVAIYHCGRIRRRPRPLVTLLSAIFILALRVVCLFPVCRSYKDGGPYNISKLL